MNSPAETDDTAPPPERESAPRTPLSAAEKWILSGLAVMVLAIVVPLLLGGHAARLQRMARADLETLVAASGRYFSEYGRWPTARMGTANDVRYGDDRANREVLNILRAVDGPGNEGHRGNPNQIVFIEPGRNRFLRSGLTTEGDWVDPWGMPYQIALDTDMNDVVTMIRSAYPNVIGVGIAIWSYGPDRRSDTAQDIVSWE